MVKHEGRVEGIVEGKIKNQKEVAIAMLAKELDINLISEVTKLSIEAINLLKNLNNKEDY